MPRRINHWTAGACMAFILILSLGCAKREPVDLRGHESLADLPIAISPAENQTCKKFCLEEFAENVVKEQECEKACKCIEELQGEVTFGDLGGCINKMAEILR